MTKFLTKVAFVSFLLVGAVAVAPAAYANGDPRIGCADKVTRHQVRQQTVYLAGPADRRWVYLETNHQPGLQRNDDQCENPGSSHDTVIASTRILCTCDYPFGDYPPNSWVQRLMTTSLTPLPPKLSLPVGRLQDLVFPYVDSVLRKVPPTP